MEHCKLELKVTEKRDFISIPYFFSSFKPCTYGASAGLMFDFELSSPLPIKWVFTHFRANMKGNEMASQ